MSNLVNHLKDFFSLETLDGRLKPSENQLKRQAIINRVNPQSRWSSLEFKLYGVVFAIIVPLMFKTGMDASNETNPNYPRFAHLLSNGWMWGRKVDNSDQQYRFFRDNFLMLCGLISIHCLLRRIVNIFSGTRKRTYFDFGFGILFLIGAHGVNCLKIFIHILISFSIAHYIPSYKIAITLVWIFVISTLFINHHFRNFKIGVSLVDDGFKGIIARWDVFFNFTLLRMLSYALDYLEKKRQNGNLLEKSNSNLSNLDDRQRLEAPLPISDYNIINYIAYITYTPLFIAGPIITFNDYIYQSNYQQLATVTNYKRTFIYFLRLMFCIFVMEFILHHMYVVAVSKTKAWNGDSPFQISMIGMFNLNIIWLKLLIPWRLFRFWSLLDGIDPPENMIRCMDNNFSAVAFWRAWHRSYNKWIVRYIYIPLGGGGKYRILNSLFVFSFVAIWHDIELRLLMWGWLVVIFLLPEILATYAFKRYQEESWFRYLCGFGAVINIWMMMIANLFGFCLGKDGTLHLLHDLFRTFSGIQFFILSSGALFVASQVMFELRENEMRRGINVKC
ncbi:MBOAT, membrane-bound O-acyltransferase family-domain-containing protein [Scheffersomyces amazonensis]|uniref:MBOAT, membrane-bound O-acyltransferase family-domain-containing protein n=1 Tax=Scheffersomyces amazonensis TaxID=1078765 RepID=UPI00315CC8F1